MPKFRVTTTAQVERSYEIDAASDEQARKRMTSYKHDPDMFAPGIVVEDKDAQRDTTPQRITEVKLIAKPKSVATPKAGGSAPAAAPPVEAQAS